MALARAVAPRALKGHSRPRVAPPLPARSDIAGFREVAADIGITLMPWQETSARYSEALAPDGRHLFREDCEVAARQNGKTEKIVVLVVKRLRAGRRIIHTAQNRDLPREVFARVADIMSQDMSLFPQRNGRALRPRFANGQEEIALSNGGRYKIVAPTRGGARGGTNDDVIIDEARELDSFEFIAAVKPTMTASKDPQMLYYSNAGDEQSIVLNALRKRAGQDPALAYLEWSAAPQRAADDRIGWAEANPALGNEVGEMGSILESLENEYRSALLEGNLAMFETEHLTRWVLTMRELLVDIASWNLCEAELPAARRPYMAVSMDPSGRRASAAIAWQDGDRVYAKTLFDVTGNPIDTDKLGTELRQTAQRLGVRKVGLDPMTDGELAKYFLLTQKVSGNDWANASAQFVNLVGASRLSWADCAAVTDDLTWTARKMNDERGSFVAVRANDDHPVTAALAIIRAVWLASGPTPVGEARIW